MTEPQTPAGVVPYVEHWTGARRVIVLDLDVGDMGVLAMPAYAKRRVSPVVSIDGRQFPVYWGVVSFEVPATRAVQVAVSIDDSIQVASVLLHPGPGLRLVYRTDKSGSASLTPMP